MMIRAEKRTWAEINLVHLEHNYRTLRALLPQGCRFLGVVKADAYGHGAVQIAHRLETLGAEYLAVACIDEAAILRDKGINAPILILGMTDPEFTHDLLALGLTQTVSDAASARAYAKAAEAEGKRLSIHLKADTGMSRFGFLWDEPHRAASVAEMVELAAMPGLKAEGVFTHFADADGSEAYTMLQFTRFLDGVKGLEEGGVTGLIRHCAASAAVLKYPCTHLDMVRPGIALYGHYPSPDCEELDGPGLRSVLSLKTRVAAAREMPAGACVSYGRTHTLSRDSRLAVLPIGYADGLPRLCSNGLEVSVRGQKVPIVGRVCMDLCMADVTDVPEVAVGDTVTIYGGGTPVEDAAVRAGTIQYELLCAISPRVPREYLEG